MRLRWEFSHPGSAVLNAAALVFLVVATTKPQLHGESALVRASFSLPM